jgi:hypothetical protein
VGKTTNKCSKGVGFGKRPDYALLWAFSAWEKLFYCNFVKNY